ncbi:MAG: hypothetical protein FJY82_03385 [Candidatus Aminicenantes bacterium]|nr:hypothetical protein [Candidatus Aminicenantes bacterium]
MRRGISVMEAVLGLAISSIVVLAVLSMYTKGQHVFVNQAAFGDALEESRYPFACLSRDVKAAFGVAASWTVGGETYASSANALVLSLPAVDADGIIIEDSSQPLGTHLDHIVYAVAEGRLERIYDPKPGVSAKPGSRRYLADNIRGLAFTYYGDNGTALSSGFAAAVSIGAQVTVRQRGAGSRFFDRMLDSRFKLRNK